MRVRVAVCACVGASYAPIPTPKCSSTPVNEAWGYCLRATQLVTGASVQLTLCHIPLSAWQFTGFRVVLFFSFGSCVLHVHAVLCCDALHIQRLPCGVTCTAADPTAPRRGPGPSGACPFLGEPFFCLRFRAHAPPCTLSLCGSTAGAVLWLRPAHPAYLLCGRVFCVHQVRPRVRL